MADFEGLRARLREMDRRQAGWNEGFRRAYARLRRRRGGLFRGPSADEERELAEAARREAGEGLALEMFAFLDELSDTYLSETLPQNQAKLRADVGALEAMPELLWSYAELNAELLKSPADERRLLRALCAVSLEDLHADLEQVDALLARIWLGALRAGLDPRPAFEAVAAVSNPGTGGGSAFTQRHLRGFERSLAFKRLVVSASNRSSA